jgi:hypothetical protein
LEQRYDRIEVLDLEHPRSQHLVTRLHTSQLPELCHRRTTVQKGNVPRASHLRQSLVGDQGGEDARPEAVSS